MIRSGSGLLALTAALWRSIPAGKRIWRLMEQTARAAALAWALGGQIKTDSLPYPVFLLCGLAQWYYFREILQESLGGSAQYSRLLCAWGADPALFSVAQAIAAFPTLLFWTAASALAALAFGIPIRNGLILLALLPCSLFNGVMQGLLAAAFVPLFGQKAGDGLGVTLPVLFWTTPIAWPFSEMASETARFLMRLNPLYCLSEGMRVWLTGGILSSNSAASFFAAAGVAGLIGLYCMRRVWRALPAV